MTATTASFIVALVAMVLLAGVIIVALHVKGNVRASGKIGAGSFTIETTEKQK